MSQIFEILTSRRLRQWSRKFPSKIFYPFLARHSRKLLIGLFNRCATRKGLKNPRLNGGITSSTHIFWYNLILCFHPMICWNFMLSYNIMYVLYFFFSDFKKTDSKTTSQELGRLRCLLHKYV